MKDIGDGKRVWLPCGHEGEVIIGQFALCLVPGCDGLPWDEEPTKPGKPYCPVWAKTGLSHALPTVRARVAGLMAFTPTPHTARVAELT